jgi:hypothetical protein
MPWSRKFDDPIPLPGRKPILTLRDAARYIMPLSAKDKKSDAWQAAIEALLMAAEERGPIMHARIGVLRALNRHVVREFTPSRKSTNWGKRKLARDR